MGKGFVHIGTVIFLIFGLLASYYLVQNRTFFNPKAFLSPRFQEPDLDVTYIERTPKYQRFCVEYESGGFPVLCPGTEKEKRWPDTGEKLTYSAHIINKGTDAAPETNYIWKVNGVMVRTGTLKALKAGEEAVESLEFNTSAPLLKK